MKPKLSVLKRKKFKKGITATENYFAILDSDNPDGYPANFVCILPYREEVFKANASRKAEFTRIFGVNSLMQARNLLNEALIEESDPLIIKKIEKRLGILSMVEQSNFQLNKSSN